MSPFENHGGHCPPNRRPARFGRGLYGFGPDLPSLDEVPEVIPILWDHSRILSQAWERGRPFVFDDYPVPVEYPLH